MQAIEILYKKAQSQGFRAWFAQNDLSLPNYSLKKEIMFSAFGDAINEAENIDCIWFDGEMNMPALFKVCAENIFEGLCRLNNVKNLLPPYFSKHFLVISDSSYMTAMNELIKPTFKNSGITILKVSELFDSSFSVQ